MTPKEKAAEIYDRMDYFTNGYVGSSMLSNTEFSDVKVKNTKALALLIVDQIENALTEYGSESNELQNMDSEFRFWDAVRNEINALNK